MVLAWNDLGMHCYNRNFQDLGVLPPFNNLWAQVIKVGDPPQIITSGIEVTYEFPNNTYSVGKVRFLDLRPATFRFALPSSGQHWIDGQRIGRDHGFGWRSL